MNYKDQKTPVTCPQCKKTEEVTYVLIQRIRRSYRNPIIEEYEPEGHPGKEVRVLIVPSDFEEEGIDSMGNDEHFHCGHCDHDWHDSAIEDVVEE
jgi:hypothetical protein